MIETEEETYQIMTDKNMKADDEYMQPIIDQNKEEIQDLLNRANEKWELK